MLAEERRCKRHPGAASMQLHGCARHCRQLCQSLRALKSCVPLAPSQPHSRRVRARLKKTQGGQTRRKGGRGAGQPGSGCTWCRRARASCRRHGGQGSAGTGRRGGLCRQGPLRSASLGRRLTPSTSNRISVGRIASVSHSVSHYVRTRELGSDDTAALGHDGQSKGCPWCFSCCVESRDRRNLGLI
jgi:hypothetical protein